MPPLLPPPPLSPPPPPLQARVEVRTYDVIYNLLDDVRAAMEGKLESVEERQPLGTATVKAVFGASGGKVAGVVVTDGKLAKVRAPPLPPLPSWC